MTTKRYSGVDLLHPKLQEACKQFLLWANLHRDKKTEVFETWRSPERSRQLAAEKKVLAADAWKSWHNYGLAFDVAYKDEKGNWTWDGDWDETGRVGKSCGLIWGGDWLAEKQDRPHFQLDLKGLKISEAKEIEKTHGVLGVWAEINKRYADGKTD